MSFGGGDAVELGDRALLADTAGAALSASDGTIDWWCRRLDEDPALYGILDAGGPAVRVTPAGGREGPQCYDDDTFVARTRLTGDGAIEVADALAWDGTTPPARIVRLVTCLAAGEVVVRVRGNDLECWSEGAAGRGFHVRAGVPMAVVGPSVAEGSVRLETGERLAVTIDDGKPPPLSPDRAAAVLGRTTTAWRRVLVGAEVEGPWTAMVRRSLLVLCALSGETGALVRAPTTSLPEVEGGERNDEGRLVDTAGVAEWVDIAARARLGEAVDAAVGWLRAIVERGVPLATVLGVDGDAPGGLHEPSWSGWRRSQPVRLGADPPEPSAEGAAAEAAALAAVLRVAAGPGGAPLRGEWDRLVALADRLAERPATPAGRAALAAMVQCAPPLDLDAAGWHAARVAADRALGARPPGEVAAAWLGPWPASEPAFGRLLDERRQRFGVGPWLAPDPPAASVLATLEEARALAAHGRREEADLALEAVGGLAGPLGLLPAAVEVLGGQPRGNRPFTPAHLAFVAAALQAPRG